MPASTSKLTAWTAVAAVALPLGLASRPAQAIPVGLELSLLVDVSGSISTAEFNLQKQGYVNAFNNVAVQNAILANPTGSIAVNFVQWAGAGSHVQSVAFTLINSAASATAFATALNGVTRAFSGGTAPGSAINYAVPLFTNGFEGQRLVIDVSGDGAQSEGADTSDARDAALAAGVTTINGLPIGNATLAAFYANNIVGGANGFNRPAAGFADFGDAILDKLVREVTPVPEPASLALFGVGMLGLGLLRRRA